MAKHEIADYTFKEVQEAIVTLFKEVQHGDQEHREWLQEKVKTWAWDQFGIVLTQDDLRINAN